MKGYKSRKRKSIQNILLTNYSNKDGSEPSTSKFKPIENDTAVQNKTEKDNSSKLYKCQKCAKTIQDFEVFQPSNCTHNFCAECIQFSGHSGNYHCPVCHTELFWFQQAISGHRFFLGEFDSLRASLIESVNQCQDLITEFQKNIIKNFDTIDNHNTQMITKLYICLKSLQSSTLWDDIQLFKIDMTEEDGNIMLDFYWALTEIAQCEFDDTTGAEKHNIIDDMTDNVPYTIWLRKHLLKLKKYLDPTIFAEDTLEEAKDKQSCADS